MGTGLLRSRWWIESGRMMDFDVRCGGTAYLLLPQSAEAKKVCRENGGHARLVATEEFRTRRSVGNELEGDSARRAETMLRLSGVTSFTGDYAASSSHDAGSTCPRIIDDAHSIRNVPRGGSSGG